MTQNRKTNSVRAKTAGASKASKNYAKEYEEILRLAHKDPVKLSHEWNKEGDVFRECTLYSEERSVLTMHTTLL
jgi:hypothetical protein